ncbi:MAG: polysaccharide biosynthesis tyrosine autokinase, partial [Myxococcales bacterium]|nr:polysaccharide biosynthesis tyrosine autokinase [Myxococcales bacterium]
APGYPRIQKLRAGVLSTRRRLNGEIQNIVDGLETSFLAAKEKEEELRRSVESQKTEALRVKDAAVEYAVLRSDAETSRLLYDGVRERIRETELAADLHSSNVFVVDAATTPLKPSRPKVMRNLALALVLGLLTSVGLAFVADFLDSRVRTTDELERRIGLPSLGVVPELNAVTRGGQPRPPLIGPQSGGGKPSKTKTGLGPDPMVMEAYRTIRTAILLSKPDEPPKTILITSPSEAEGKTTTALNMAAMFAQLGQKTLLIDADLRKPSCHTLLGADNTTGLTEALIGGKASPQLFSVLDSKLAFLSSGQRPPNPIELLASDRMAELLEQFRNSFGFILIDAPPLNPVSDSLVLSRMVDGVVLVADAQSTTRHSLRQARTQLRKAHAKVLGAVLNRGKSAEHYAYFVEWNSSSG